MIPLKLGEYAKHWKHRLPAVVEYQVLLVKEQTDTFSEAPGERWSVSGSTTAIHDRMRPVELCRVHRFNHGVKARALILALGAADAIVLVRFDDLPAGNLSARL